MGTQAFVSKFIEDKIDTLGVDGTPFECLTAQEKMHIVTWSSASQFNHIIRTDSGGVTQGACAAIDNYVLGAKGLLFRHVLDRHESEGDDRETELAADLASLPVALGGLGIIRARMVEKYASVASWSHFYATDLCKIGHTREHLREQVLEMSTTSQVAVMIRSRVEGLREMREGLTLNKSVLAE